MTKELQYGGYTAQPSDYKCPDGEMGVMMNLLKENGELKPVLPPLSVFSLNSGYKAVYIHKTNEYTHFICYGEQDRTLYFSSNNGQSWTQFSTGVLDPDGFTQMSSIGNILLVLTPSYGPQYYIWKDNAYSYLGLHLPEFAISFGLLCKIKKSYGFDVTFDADPITLTDSEGNTHNALAPDSGNNRENGVDKLTPVVLAKVNKFINDEIVEKGHFGMPFFIRYAFRLYDGTLVMHSAPVLMIPSSGVAPTVFLNSYSSGSQDSKTANLRVMSPACDIDYACETDPIVLDDWKDIITSVDIFVSEPIYAYDQNGDCETFALAEEDEAVGIFQMNHLSGDSGYSNVLNTINKYQEWRVIDAIRMEEHSYYHPVILKLPKKGDESFKSSLADCGTFYLLKSIPIEDLQMTRTLIEFDEDYLKALANRETMTDDYEQHDKLIPSKAMTYNAREVFFNLKKKLYSGQQMYFIPFMNGRCTATWSSATSNSVPTQVSNNTYFFNMTYAYVYLKKNGGEDIIRQLPLGELHYCAKSSQYPLYYFYYPDADAYKVVIHNNNGYGIVLPLKKHATLNGAFYFNDFAKLSSQAYAKPNFSSNVVINLENKVYNSEVENPFFYPARGITTVGAGRIIGLATAATPLSEGQFGDYPLYAFTDTGVWAIQISDTGTFVARQPITQDVAISENGICSMDNSVAFAADRGIMIISGRHATCISDEIDAVVPDILHDFPHGNDLFGFADFASIGDNMFRYIDFKQYIQNALLVWDYRNQRLIVFASKLYAYIYSLASKSWGIMYAPVVNSKLNGYPNSYVWSFQHRTLYNLSSDAGDFIDINHPSRDTYIRTLFITRPLKLDAPDVLKTIDTIIQRGYFKTEYDDGEGRFGQVLYGSRDLKNWFTVWSSKDRYLRGFRGTPYKYFRIAVVAWLRVDESITGATIEYTPRLTNKHR